MTTAQQAQEQSRLNRLHQLLESDVFDRKRPDDGATEQAFAEVVRLLDDVLHQSEAAGHRIDFIQEVGVHGKLQDITSLVSSLRHTLTPTPGTADGFDTRRFNCYYDAGTGYFANGVFFAADHDQEVAFFVDDQRIYLNRHIKRALQEAEHYLTATSGPATAAQA